MSEHTHVYETPTNPTTNVASPSTTASALQRQMTRERQVEQDTILGDHLPDGQGGCHRSTDSPPSYYGSASLYSEQGTLSRAQLTLHYYRLYLRFPLASSFSSDIDDSCRESNRSAADVSCALKSPSIQSHRGRDCLPGAAVLEPLRRSCFLP
jgi:hypothetical protein